MRKIDRSKRTKAELLSELKQLEERLHDAPSVDPTAQSLARERAAKTREDAKSLSVDTIVSKGASFGLEVQRTISSLTEQAAQKSEELRTLQEAVTIEQQELERLYQLDVASASVKALIEEHTERKAALEREIADARHAWAEEVAAHNRAVQQRNADVQAQRQREQQEYDYRTRQERQRAQDDFDYKLQIADRAQKERAGQFEKDMAVRVAEITRQEKELAQGRARIEGLDGEVKARVDKEVAIATNSLKSTLTSQFTLEKKDLEMQLQLSAQRNSSLIEQNNRLAAEIAKLHVALDAARAEVKDIAIKSVEGASGQTALQKVMEVQRENGQTPRNKA